LSFYPPKIQASASEASRAGTVDSPDAVGTEASFVCGSFVTLSLEIDADGSQIVEAKYRSNGCGYAVAACETVALHLLSRRLQDLHGVRPDELVGEIEATLGIFPADREHCSRLVIGALRAVLAAYRSKLIDEYNGERALVCTCFGVDDETIENCIRENNLEDIEGIIDHCRAGGGCGSCQPVIREMLDSVQFGP
jgi:NifU-like protein